MEYLGILVNSYEGLNVPDGEWVEYISYYKKKKGSGGGTGSATREKKYSGQHTGPTRPGYVQ